MKATDIEIGGIYLAKVSGKLVRLRVEEIRWAIWALGKERIGWICTNLDTGRQIVVRSPQRFRERVPQAKCVNLDCPNDVPYGCEGGYCPSCCNAIEDAENEQHAQLEEAEQAKIANLPASREPDPHEEYGFDYPWETR